MEDDSRVERNQKKLLSAGAGGLAALLLAVSLVEPAFAFKSAEFAIKELCGHMTGSLGGLLMSAAAVGGIAAAAFGNFRASFSFIITGIGAFTITALLSLYFPAAADQCAGGDGNAGPEARQVIEATEGGQAERATPDDGSDIFANF